MESLGERLKKAREEKSFSRADIAEATKISDRRLEDLENDRLELLPPPVFVRGFIRAYCRQVGLEEKELLGVYEEMLKGKGLRHQEHKEAGQEKKSRSGMCLALVLVVVALIALVYYWHASPVPRKVPASGSAADQTLKESEVPPASPEVKEKPRQERSAASPVPAAQPVVMAVKCHSTTWLEVTIDNGLPSEVTLVPGDEINWEGKERIELSLGNAGGVTLRVNGVALRPFGKPKEAVGLVFEGNTVSVRGKPAQSLTEWQEPGTEGSGRLGE